MPVSSKEDRLLLIGFTIAVLGGPIVLAPFGAGYPDLLQKFAIFGIFAIGYNILFGLTGYLSFGHAAFKGKSTLAQLYFQIMVLSKVRFH